MPDKTSLSKTAGLRLGRWLGWAAIYRDYFLAQDETTRRLKKALNENPWKVYPGTAPESGRRHYSSLGYPTAEIAQAAFDRQSHTLVYGREGTPDGDTLTKALLQIDPAAADGRVTGHGMGAIEASLLGVKSGEHIVASKHIFGTTKKNLLDLQVERGISVTFVDGRKPEQWEAAIQPGQTRLFIYEPLGNPGMEIVDTRAVAAIAHKNKRDILVVADNSMTPLDQSLSKGADIVAFSTTKLLGLGVDNGGGVLVSKEGLLRLSRLFPDQPPNLPPGYPVLTKVPKKGLTQSHHGAYAMLKNVATSVIRHNRQQKTASGLVHQLLADHHDLRILSPELERSASSSVRSQVFSIDLGDQATAFTFTNALARQGVGIVNNFGSDRTTVVHPGTTTQSSLSRDEQLEQGISPGLVRVSVGVEPLGYLRRAFNEALRLT